MTTILLTVRVHSPAMPDATALAVRDGVIAWLGSDDVGRSQFPDAQVIDLDGAFVEQWGQQIQRAMRFSVLIQDGEVQILNDQIQLDIIPNWRKRAKA